eukprot:jgi/Ulvmu1/8366/UM042_0072.1
MWTGSVLFLDQSRGPAMPMTDCKTKHVLHRHLNPTVPPGVQIGSVFEFFNKNSIFGVVEPSSPLYLPILGVFAVTGLPTAGWLFLKAVTVANQEAERMDKADGM